MIGYRIHLSSGILLDSNGVSDARLEQLGEAVDKAEAEGNQSLARFLGQIRTSLEALRGAVESGKLSDGDKLSCTVSVFDTDNRASGPQVPEF